MLLETKNITMVFGNLKANDNVDFCCKKGEVVSLLGENGAGKTTLMNIIYGLYQPTSGSIYFEGNKVDIKSPRHAIKLGIQMVHQHFMLVDHLMVYENVVMGKEPKKHGLFDKHAAIEKVKLLSETYGLKVNPMSKVSELSVGEKQRTEIIKALYHGAKLLILDEPTAVLTPQETEELFKVVNRLREDGRSIIIITHKLHETMSIADSVFVLRNGRISGHVKKEETNPKELTQMMVAHELAEFQKTAGTPGEIVLKVSELSLESDGAVPVLNNLNLDIFSGEIYGLAGIEGNGQQELVETLCGIERSWSGSIEILGTSTKGKKVRALTEMGVVGIHSDRHDRGLLLDLSGSANMMLGYHNTKEMKTKMRLLNKRYANEMCLSVIEKYKVSPPDAKQNVRNFSGGNQQKLMIGRELKRNPKLAIIAHPTRGVDVGVCEIIHQSILDLRDSGSAILLITADYDELFKLSDRIGVIYEGSIVTEGKPDEYTPHKLGFYMGGGKSSE